MNAIVQSAPGTLRPMLQTSGQIITTIERMMNERYNAVNAYPAAPSAASRFELIRLIRWEMEGARLAPNEVMRMKLILRQHRNLLLLTPKRPLKRMETYKAKVEALMSDCRTYLGWKEQLCTV